MKTLILNILDVEKSTLFNLVIIGKVEVVATPQMALDILNGVCEFYELTNQNKDIKVKRPYVEISRHVNDVPKFFEFEELLLQNVHIVEKIKNKNFDTVYAVFEDGAKYQLESKVIGEIPKTNSDWMGKSTYSDGNIWTGDSKND